MTVPASRAARLCLQFLSDWLAERAGRPIHLDTEGPITGADAFIGAGTSGDRRLAAALVFVVPPDGDGPWYRAKDRLAARLAGRLDGGYLIWVPQGADLPEREPGVSELITRVEETLGRFVPGGHGEVRFPVPITIRKSDAEGSYVTARGGLANSWARFTNRVFGHFQLDSNELHRPPAGEGNLTGLIDRLVEVANELELGRSAVVETEEAWIAQRLRGGEGVAFVGAPPDDERSSGAGLRRSLRRTMQALREPLLAQPADARLVCIVGPYTSIDEQPVGPALLGFDPTLYHGIDLICLAAEAQIKPLLDLTGNPLLAPAG